MRPTDEEIEKQAFKWDHSIQDKEDFELGAKWARDFDPWHYIEDGDLPKLESTKEGHIKETGEPLNIAISSPVLISCGKGDFAKAYFLTYESLNGYIYEWFEKHTNRLEFKVEEIKCWMHIPEPKK